MNAEPGKIGAGLAPDANPLFRVAGLEPFEALADRATQLRRALAQLADVGDENTARKIARMNEDLAGFEPAVTMIGQVKSGKTTLVNAMAGKPDFLPADVNPWTSVVTSLHLAPGRSALGTGARFRFFDEDEWDRLLSKGGRIGELANRAGAHDELDRIRDQIEAMRRKTRARLGRKFELLLGQTHDYTEFDRDLIERYICLGDFEDEAATDGEVASQGRFADITRSADLYLPHDGLPAPLCLRDTPGVNDTFMMREQITVRAIRDSRICVVVLSAHQALTAVDMALIRLISTVRSREVVIFVNRIDELSDPAGQVPEIESSIRQTLKDQSGPVDARIVFGSAFWACRALSGDLGNMPPESSAALLNWAEGTLRDGGDDRSAAETIWRLSGVPALFAALAERIAEGAGREQIDKVSRSALNLANGLRVATDSGRAGGRPLTARMAVDELDAEILSLASRHFRSLEAALEELAGSYRQRLDRAHESFLNRATDSLVTHLERKGSDMVWEYSPTGLRMLLRSAYNVFGTATQQATRRVAEAAAADLRDLYSRAFGVEPDDYRVELPEPHRVPPPVFIGQTIALDFRGHWWTSWWRRWRGRKALARNFNDLILAETAPIVAELKEAQAEEICRAAVGILDEFLDEQRVVLNGIMESCVAGDGGHRAPHPAAGDDARRRTLELTLETLTRCAA